MKRRRRRSAGPPQAQANVPAGANRLMQSALAALLIAAVIAAVFGQIAWHGFFTWDDNIHVTENPYLHPPSWEHLRELWLTPYRKLYIPVSYMFFALEAQISRLLVHGATEPLSPVVFHVGSLLLHLLNALLVWRILMMLIGQVWPAALGALLFGIHPLQVESVAWISETRGLLSGLFALLSMWLYLKYSSTAQSSADVTVAERGAFMLNWKAVTYYALATAAYLTALLAKPSAVAVPLMLVLVARTWHEQPWISIIKSLAIWIVLAVVVAGITTAEQNDVSIAEIIPLSPLLLLNSLAFYTSRLLIPLGLAIQYDRLLSTLLRSPSGWGELALLCCVPIALWWVSRASRTAGKYYLACAGIFAAALLPVSGLIPFTFQQFSTVADRYAYLALVGPAIALGTWLGRGNFGLRSGVAVAWLLVLGVLSFLQTSLWSDDRDLYRHTLDVNPRSFIAHNHFGLLLKNEGNLQEAIQHYRQAVADYPDYFHARYNLANALILANRRPEAQQVYRDIVRDYRGQYRAHFQLGRLLARDKKFDEAADQYRAAMALRPQFAAPRVGLAAALALAGKPRDAVAEYREALGREPRSFDARYQLAWILSTCADASVRKPADAIALAKDAHLAPPRQKSIALDVLAAALAADGQFDKALPVVEQAIESARTNREPQKRLDEMMARLELYRSRQPFVDIESETN